MLIFYLLRLEYSNNKIDYNFLKGLKVYFICEINL